MQALAEYLVSLVGSKSLTNNQTDEIIQLWNCLHPYDRDRVIYPARHKSTLPTGKFARSKTNVVPGVDSVKRLLLLFQCHLLIYLFLNGSIFIDYNIA